MLGAFWEDGSESCGYDQLVWGWRGVIVGGVHPEVSHMEHIVCKGMGVASVEAEGGRFTKEGQRVDARGAMGLRSCGRLADQLVRG